MDAARILLGDAGERDGGRVFEVDRVHDLRAARTRYGWLDAAHTGAHEYLLPELLVLVRALAKGRPRRVIDLGCGNGSVASRFVEEGHVVTAVDVSPVIRRSERDWLLIVNLWEAWRILRAERPDLVLSTGAGPAVPFALVAKLKGTPFVFVETDAQVTRPSLTGRIMYRLADRFFYQWRTLEPYFPQGTYGGFLL